MLTRKANHFSTNGVPTESGADIPFLFSSYFTFDAPIFF